MSRRLLTLRMVQQEKLPRSRSWIFAEIAAGRFPKPLDLGGAGPNLFIEEDVDRYLEQFIAKAKNREEQSEGAAKRTERARQLVEARKQQAAA